LAALRLGARIAVPDQRVAGVVAFQDQQEAGEVESRRVTDRRGVRRRPEAGGR